MTGWDDTDWTAAPMTLAEERLDFKVAVLACDRGCRVHDDPSDCGGDVQAHHVVTQQQLREEGLEPLLWDPSNGMAVCDRAHDRHHSGHERIPRDRIPQRCLDFAARHDLSRYLDRYYAGGVS